MTDQARAQAHYDLAWKEYAEHKRACRSCNPRGEHIAPKEDRCDRARSLYRVVAFRKQARDNRRDGVWP